MKPCEVSDVKMKNAVLGMAVIGSLLVSALLLAGCGAGGARSAAPQGPIHVLPGAKSGRADSTVISLNAVTLPPALKERLAKGIQVYSLRYWSRGQRAQAYLGVPTSKGKHALYIQLHGGDIFGQSVHWGGPGPVTLSVVVGYALPGVVSFFPNYLGYGLSDGVPGDPAQDFRDVQNGLVALAHISGMNVAAHRTYLQSYSMGGDVAMMLAASDPDVRAVEMISPYPGARIMMLWMDKVGQAALTADDLIDRTTMISQHGTNISSAWYKDNSFDSAKVHAPVLIIGGLSDPGFPPGLLQFMASTLRKSGVEVALRLFPGGHGPASPPVIAEEINWLRAQGLVPQ